MLYFNIILRGLFLKKKKLQIMEASTEEKKIAAGYIVWTHEKVRNAH